MNENEFISEFLNELHLHMERCEIVHHKSLLYNLSIDDDGKIRKGVDTGSGEPVRGGGKGFEQDILIHDIPLIVGREVVPRVVAEVKFKPVMARPGVTTHDVIVYSEKARLIRTIYPYLRYGLILGGFNKIPGRALRLGQGFDFIFAISYPFVPQQIELTRKALEEEVQTSRDLARAFRRHEIAITSFRRRVEHDMKDDRKTLAGGGKPSGGVSRKTMKVLKDLLEGGGVWSVEQLAELTGKNPKTIKIQLKNLADGVVPEIAVTGLTKNAFGKYCVK